MRFETPEGTGPGNHDFCHSQFIRDLHGKSLGPPKWMPESQPPFPLDANDAIQLTLCALVDVYGSQPVRDMRTPKMSEIQGLRSYVDPIRSLAQI